MQAFGFEGVYLGAEGGGFEGVGVGVVGFKTAEAGAGYDGGFLGGGMGLVCCESHEFGADLTRSVFDLFGVCDSFSFDLSSNVPLSRGDHDCDDSFTCTPLNDSSSFSLTPES